jgi:hypothetical protein
VAAQVIGEKQIIPLEYMDFLKVATSIVKLLWLFAIVDYFRSKNPDFEYLKLIYTLLFFDVGLFISEWLFFQNLSFSDVYFWVIWLIKSFNFIALTVFLTMLVKSYFSERSIWFIAIELFTIVVGVLTLTPEIKRHEKELNT